MNELVLIKPVGSNLEPYTTAAVIAEYAEVQRYTIDRLIRNHESDLELFGKVGFNITTLPGSKTGQSVKIYHLNEQQATLIITYLKNTPNVRAFKRRLVNEFYSMRQELTRRAVAREISKPVRRTLTDAIRDSGEQERMNGFAFNTYTNLIYKAVTGSTAGQLRKHRGAARNASAVDFLTAAEVQAVTAKEGQVCAMLDAGMTYEEIRGVLLRKEAPPQ